MRTLTLTLARTLTLTLTLPKELVCGPMVAAAREGRDLVAALANYTTSFFYPTLEQARG